MLVRVMMYSFIALIPTALHAFDVLFKGEIWEHILLILPNTSRNQTH